MVIDDPAQDNRSGDPDGGDCEGDKSGPVEDARQEHAEDRKAGDPDHRGDEPQDDREGDPAAQSARQLPQASVEIHRQFPISRRNFIR